MNKLDRKIKSFVLRQGKITRGQKSALIDLMPIYGINYQHEPLDLDQIFARTNPKIVEIGFGMGHATCQIAKNNPENDYLGIEVHAPGVGSLLMLAKQHALNNLRIIQHDANEVINQLVDNSISGFHIFFPDPWPKQRHHKRRIMQTQLINVLCRKLKVNGYLHVATDWEEYAWWSLNLLQQNPALINQATVTDFMPRPIYRPLTKFEQRGLNLGHKIWDIIFSKKV